MDIFCTTLPTRMKLILLCRTIPAFPNSRAILVPRYLSQRYAPVRIAEKTRACLPVRCCVPVQKWDTVPKHFVIGYPYLPQKLQFLYQLMKSLVLMGKKFQFSVANPIPASAKMANHNATVVEEELQGVSPYTKALAKRVIRKIDMRVLLIMFITYNLNFMDKTVRTLCESSYSPRILECQNNHITVPF